MSLKEKEVGEKEKELAELLKIGENLFAEDNSHLTTTIIYKKFTEASVAQSKLDAAKSKLDSAQKQLCWIQEKRMYVNDKKRKLINNYKNLNKIKKS